MKNKTIIIILICFLSQNVWANSLTPIEVTKITDGDSIEARIGRNEFKVRLIGIDCYETAKINRAYKQAYRNNILVEDVVSRGLKSKKYLEDLFRDNKNVQAYLDFKGLDIYNRVLGVLYFEQLNVNESLKQHGGCMQY